MPMHASRLNNVPSSFAAATAIHYWSMELSAAQGIYLYYSEPAVFFDQAHTSAQQQQQLSGPLLNRNPQREFYTVSAAGADLETNALNAYSSTRSHDLPVVTASQTDIACLNSKDLLRTVANHLASTSNAEVVANPAVTLWFAKQLKSPLVSSQLLYA